MIVLGLTAELPCEEFAAAEARGDVLAKKAALDYQASWRALNRMRALASPLKDRETLQRTTRAQLELARLMGSRGRLQEVRARSPGATIDSRVNPAPWLRETSKLSTLPGAPAAGEHEINLGELARLITTAEKRLDPRARARDAILLNECLATIHRLRGDVVRARANSHYTAALEALSGRSSEARTDVASARRVRILFKSGRWHEAASAMGTPPTAGAQKGDDGWSLDDRQEHLRVAHTLAAFGMLEAAPRAKPPTESELVLLGSGLGSFLRGRPVDLARTAETILDALRLGRMPRRATALCAYVAALAASELGELPVAEEILSAYPPEPQSRDWFAATARARLGALRGALGDYEGAISALEEADAWVNRSPHGTALKSRIAVDLARSLLGVGLLNRARERAFHALACPDAPPDLRLRARLLIGAVFYEKARNDRQALSDAQATFRVAARDLETMRARLDPLARAELDVAVSVNLANALYRELKLQTNWTPRQRDVRRKDVVRLQNHALETADAAGLFSLAAVAAGNLGELYLEEGDIKTSRQFVEWALARADEHRLFETQWRCHWYLARLADGEGDGRRADAEYDRAMHVIESYRGRIVDLEKRSGFLNDKTEFYRDLVRREIRRGRLKEALTAAERSKARGLVESLGWRFLKLGSDTDSELYREFITLMARMARTRQGRPHALLGVRTHPQNFDQLRARLQVVKNRLLEAGKMQPALRALANGCPVPSEALLQLVPRDHCLIEFFGLGSHLVAFLVQDGGVEVVQLSVNVDTLPARVERYVSRGAGDARLATELFTDLFEPLRDRVRHRHLLIVPFGALHQVPFETLRSPRGYLLDDYDIAYLPAGSLLQFARDRPCAPDSLRLLAIVDPRTDYDGDGQVDLPPLPFAREEVAGFAWRFNTRAVLVGEDAIESEWRRQVGLFNVIHCACHGEFYPTRPWESPLFMAPSKVGESPDNDSVNSSVDGKLRAGEVFGIDLRRSCLVTLSGCETGRNQVRPGDDPVSISAAFLHSGATSLLVSLWRVEDQATSQLMRSFYANWTGAGRDGGTMDKAQALQAAKREMIKTGFSHPRQWGAFVLMGGR